MRVGHRSLALAALTSLATAAFPACAGATGALGEPVALPGGPPGIGFDDLRFSSALDKVLVPAGRSGAIDLVDPATGAVTAIAGFSADKSFGGGHDFGVTSVDIGDGLLFATDRTSQKLVVVDPARRTILGAAKLAASPDYVRWVAPTREIWVTEPDAEALEVFTLPRGAAPVPVAAARIRVPGGPESLVIDAARGRAFTHLWSGKTVAVDLATRAVVATFPNGCSGSRGIDLDEARGLLFAGCAEGKAVVLDAASGKILASRASGSGVDIIAYDKALGHLYLPGASSATMAILGVSDKGQLALLGTVPTASGAHCVTVDRHGSAYVCDPARGQLLKFRDPYPKAR